jgi:hypothetical protein
MITRQDVEAIVAGWARTESERHGCEVAPMVAEFDLGFVVWTTEGVRTVIDRETGALSTWPGLPAESVAQMYRERRPELAAQRHVVDPMVELRRRSVPTSATHLTVDGRLFIGRGAKGDQEIDHHPLVREFLATVEPGGLVRGAHRHGEIIALSDALYEADRVRAASGVEPIEIEDARAWLLTATCETFFVREAGDPLAGLRSRPCETCIRTLVNFALLPWSDLALIKEWSPEPAGEVAQPGRFPAEVAGVLADGGWMPLPADVAEALADAMIEETVEVIGRRFEHAPLPAARRLLADFPGVMCGRRGPGVQRAIRLLRLDPTAAAHTADMLGELGPVIGGRLFPIGVEAEGDTILAVDEQGRIFALDQAGEWFLGESIDEAITSLLTGDGPARRIHDDGTW